MLLGSSHAEVVREARDSADKTLVIASHRFAGAAKSLILAPVFAASKRARDLNVRLFYGEDSRAITATDIAGLTNEAAKVGVRIRPVHRPRLHAKFLTRDDDVAIITSQNWLSADSTDDNPRQEIGIYVRSPGVGRILMERSTLRPLRRVVARSSARASWTGLRTFACFNLANDLRLPDAKSCERISLNQSWRQPGTRGDANG